DPSARAKLITLVWKLPHARLHGLLSPTPPIATHRSKSLSSVRDCGGSTMADWLYDVYVYAQKVARLSVVLVAYSPTMIVFDVPSMMPTILSRLYGGAVYPEGNGVG